MHGVHHLAIVTWAMPSRRSRRKKLRAKAKTQGPATVSKNGVEENSKATLSAANGDDVGV